MRQQVHACCLSAVGNTHPPRSQKKSPDRWPAWDLPGVFAPAGWHCRTWYGSAGAYTVVTPDAPPANSDLAHTLSGPAVEVEEKSGGTSGRFQVAEVSARFFPDLMRQFIR